MSPVNGGEMLRALGSGIVPAGVERSPVSAADGAAFSDLLARARGGEVKSGLPVTVPAGLGVELDAEGHERLNAAVDALEAAGARRGLVLIDGHALVVDVSNRSVDAIVGDASKPVNVDAVVRAGEPYSDRAADDPLVPHDPRWGFDNDGLARLLAG